MYCYLIWDVDGTLFDTYPAMTNAYCKALRDLGITPQLNRILTLAKISLVHCTNVLAAEYRLDAVELMELFQEHYAAISPANQPPFRGLAPVLKHVRAAGGANVIVTHRSQSSLAHFLSIHNLQDYFDGTLSVQDGYPRKPDPAMYTTTIERHGFDRAQTLAVGDREIDAAAGAAAGVSTCLFRPAFQSWVSDYRITDYQQLFQILRPVSSS